MLIILTSHPIQYQAPLWRALAEEGLRFEVWFLTDQGLRTTNDPDFGKAFAWDVDLLAGYPHRFLALRGPWDLRRFRGIRPAAPIGETLRRAGATALWVEGWRFTVQWDAVAAARRLRIPVLLRGETSDKIAEKTGVFGLLRKLALRRLFSKVDHFLAIGKPSRRFYRRHGVPDEKLIDAPYCVDNDFFRTRGIGMRRADASEEASRQSIRKAWNIPTDARVVLFCGKFVGKKRPMDVVRAVNRLRELAGGGGRDWHLLFAGSGELGSDLRAACDVRFDAGEAAAPGKADPSGPPATFAGFMNQSEICRAYAASDVLVLPSQAWETWGLVVNEATAAGVPTVVSASCGCAEDFAAKNPHTMVFEEGDIEGLAAAILQLVDQSGEPEEVSRHAEPFAPSVTAKAVARLIKDRAPCDPSQIR